MIIAAIAKNVLLLFLYCSSRKQPGRVVVCEGMGGARWEWVGGGGGREGGRISTAHGMNNRHELYFDWLLMLDI